MPSEHFVLQITCGGSCYFQIGIAQDSGIRTAVISSIAAAARRIALRIGNNAYPVQQ